MEGMNKCENMPVDCARHIGIGVMSGICQPDERISFFLVPSFIIEPGGTGGILFAAKQKDRACNGIISARFHGFGKDAEAVVGKGAVFLSFIGFHRALHEGAAVWGSGSSSSSPSDQYFPWNA